jgi:hypothetical protein
LQIAAQVHCDIGNAARVMGADGEFVVEAGERFGYVVADRETVDNRLGLSITWVDAKNL